MKTLVQPLYETTSLLLPRPSPRQGHQRSGIPEPLEPVRNFVRQLYDTTSLLLPRPSPRQRHQRMKADLRISIKDCRRNKNFKIQLTQVAGASPSAFGVAAFGRKPPFEFPSQFAALCRDAATPGFRRDQSARFPCGIQIADLGCAKAAVFGHSATANCISHVCSTTLDA